MSWQEYVDNNLVGSGHCSTAIIIGLDGSVWAKSPKSQISTQEAKALVSAFNDPNPLYSGGTNIGQTRYMTIKADPRTIIASKGATGLVAVKTNQCVLIGFYNENIRGGQCSTCVEHLADYLIECGY